MQVMKSLLDSIDRQERIDLKQQRKQETYDERLKRTSQHRFESLLLKHKDNLRKDILKKRNALEREIATEIHVRVTRPADRSHAALSRIVHSLMGCLQIWKTWKSRGIYYFWKTRGI